MEAVTKDKTIVHEVAPLWQHEHVNVIQVDYKVLRDVSSIRDTFFIQTLYPQLEESILIYVHLLSLQSEKLK